MKISKPELTFVLKRMIVESFAFVKAHIAWIQDHDINDPAAAQVSRQLSNHLMVLHWSFTKLNIIFTPEELDDISASREFISKIKLIYIEALKSGHVLACDCAYCLNALSPDPIKEDHKVVHVRKTAAPWIKEEMKYKRMKVRYGN